MTTTTPRYVGLWHGGSGYSFGYWSTDAEGFRSLEHAESVLTARKRGVLPHTLPTAVEWDDNGHAVATTVALDSLTPPVGDDCAIWLVPFGAARLKDLERDGFYGGVTHALEVGPRGGVRYTARPVRR